MLAALQSARLLTQTKHCEHEWGSETDGRLQLIRYLREIPADFRSIAQDRDKKSRVLAHLKRFYMRLPKDHEVEIVLERILNLAQYVDGGRESVEDKSAQNAYKREHWEGSPRCSICGLLFRSLDAVYLDHILPLAMGGADTKPNWQLTCKLCNDQKKQYWGAGDMSRTVGIESFQGQFFSLEVQGVMDQLRRERNTCRYWVLERDCRKCFCCGHTSAETKLCVAPRGNNSVLTVDNLMVYCCDCAKDKKVTYCE
jgi:hypothetical protein